MKYCKPTAVPDCASVGCLYQARQWKAAAWRGVQECRRRLREARMGEGASRRLELMKAERAHYDAGAAERAALEAIERRANELGLTTHRTLAHA